MSAPDFAMLVIAALSSVAAGLAYAMLARENPGFLAAKILSWAAAIGFGSLGVIWGSTNTAYPLSWRITAAAIVAAVVAGALTWIIADINGQSQETRPNHATIQAKKLPILAVECAPAKLPTDMPPDGNLTFIDFFYDPSWGDAEPIGFAGRTGQPNEKLEWYSDRTLGQTMRCVITNQASYTLFSIVFSLKVRFMEAGTEKDGRVTKSGSVVKIRDWPLAISKLDAGKSFTFYAMTQGRFFVTASFPTLASYFDPDSNKHKDARLLLLSWSAISVTPAVLNIPTKTP